MRKFRIIAAVSAAVLALMPFDGTALALYSEAAAPASVSASSVVDSGYCGTQLRWWLESDGTLTISGNDAMTSAPWGKYTGYRAKDDDTPLPDTVITKVIVDKDVKSLCYSAFNNCVYLTDAEINSNALETLPDYCFAGCKKLTAVSLPGQITKIGSYAFEGCSVLAAVTLPDAVSACGTGVFDCCNALKTVTLPAELTAVSSEMFSGCTALKSITMSEGLQEIGSRAFYDCTSLTSVTIPDSVNDVAQDAFLGAACVSVTDGVQYAGKWAIALGGLPKRDENGDWQPSDTISLTSWSIPAGTKGIAGGLLSAHKELTSVTMPDSLLAIGEGAFSGTGLTSLSLPANLRIIGDKAFKFCISMTSVRFPAGLREIGAEAFSNCNRLTSVTIPAGMQRIGSQAFYDCTALTTIRANCYDCIVPTAAKECIFGFSTDSELERTVTCYSTFTWLVNFAKKTEHYTLELLTPGAFGWSYDSTEKRLTVTDASANPAGWNDLRGQIRYITVADDVTEIPAEMFRGCTALVQVTLPKTLTRIGEYAFADCTSLSGLYLYNKNVSYIGEGTLSGCTALKNVEIANPLCEIADSPDTIPGGTIKCYENSTAHAYAEKYGLETDTSYGILYACGENLWCTGKDGILSALWMTGSFSEVIIPAGITALESGLFKDCETLKRVTLPAGFIEIGQSTFQGCEALETVNIPASMAEIPMSAFRNCYALTEIELPETVETVAEDAFSGCPNLTVTVWNFDCVLNSALHNDATVRGYVNSTAQAWAEKYGAAFAPLDTAIIVSSGSLSGYSNDVRYTLYNDGRLVIEGSGGMRSFDLEWNAVPWADFRSIITSVTVSEGVTALGDYVFQGCENMASVTLPSSLTIIGVSAFKGCCKLEAVTLPESLTEIGAGAFDRCGALREITIPAGVTALGEEAFSSCRSLTSAVFTGELQTLPESVFSGCSALETVVFPENLTEIGASAFSGCNALKEITIPEGVKSIGSGAFYGCTALETAALPDSLYGALDRTFCECTSLAALTVPEGVASIDYAFQGCDVLEELTVLGTKTEFTGTFPKTTVIVCHEGAQAQLFALKNGNPYRLLEAETVIGSGALCDGVRWSLTSSGKLTLTGTGAAAFPSYSKVPWEQDKVITAEIGEGITELGDKLFYMCKNLTYITLPDTLTTIGESAFSGCKSLRLSSVPDSVTWIKSSAFSNTNSFTQFTFPRSDCTVGNQVFWCSSVRNVICPAEMTYANTDFFSKLIWSAAGGVYSNRRFCILNPECVIGDDYYGETSEDIHKKHIIIVGYAGSTAETFAQKNGYKFEEIDPSEFTTTTVTETTTTETTTTTSETTTTETTTTETTTDTTTTETTTTTTPDRSPRAVFDTETKTLTISGEGSMADVDSLYSGYSRSSVQHIVIENGITDICENAFNDCNNLLTVEIADSVTQIGASAFKNCSALTELTLPDGVVSIGEQAFYQCNALEQIRLGSALESIGVQAFFNTGLTDIDIPASVTEIAEDAFYECGALETVTLHEGLEHIGIRAFYATALREIGIPDSVTAIDREAFWDCKQMTDAVLGRSVTEIAERLFYGCTSLETLTAKGQITEIGSLAFEYTSLKDITGLTGTALELYAQQQGLTFKEYMPQVLLGDYSGDGEITAADAVLLMRFITEDISLTAPQTDAFLLAEPDLNGDGIATLLDVRLLLRFLQENAEP